MAYLVGSKLPLFATMRSGRPTRHDDIPNSIIFGTTNIDTTALLAFGNPKSMECGETDLALHHNPTNAGVFRQRSID